MNFGIAFPRIRQMADIIPKDQWIFEDNGVTGICAWRGSKGLAPDLILPRDMSDEHRNAVLWGYEQGVYHGIVDGTEKLKADLRKMLGIR